MRSWPGPGREARPSPVAHKVRTCFARFLEIQLAGACSNPIGCARWRARPVQESPRDGRRLNLDREAGPTHRAPQSARRHSLGVISPVQPDRRPSRDGAPAPVCRPVDLRAYVRNAHANPKSCDPMNLNDPLPRLLRLRGSLARSVPADGAKLGYQDAAGLADAYIRLRPQARQLGISLGLDAEEFDSEFPTIQAPQTPIPVPEVMLEVGSDASRAATLLRTLAGHVEGLIEAVVLDQRITMEQVQAAREAARQPAGFR